MITNVNNLLEECDVELISCDWSGGDLKKEEMDKLVKGYCSAVKNVDVTNDRYMYRDSGKTPFKLYSTGVYVYKANQYRNKKEQKSNIHLKGIKISHLDGSNVDTSDDELYRLINWFIHLKHGKVIGGGTLLIRKTIVTYGGVDYIIEYE